MQFMIEIRSLGSVSGILEVSFDAVALFVLGHGTGSDMQSRVIAGLAAELVSRKVGVVRFYYPYSDHPDYVPQSGMATDSDAVMIAVLHGLSMTHQTGLSVQDQRIGLYWVKLQAVSVILQMACFNGHAGDVIIFSTS